MRRKENIFMISSFPKKKRITISFVTHISSYIYVLFSVDGISNKVSIVGTQAYNSHKQNGQ